MSAPPRVRAHLRGAPDGPVPIVHRGRDAVYVDVAGRCVGVVGRRATAVPCALRSTSRGSRSGHLDGSEGPIAAGSAYLREGVLHLDDEPLRIGRIVDVNVPLLRDITSTASSTTGAAIPPAAVDELAAPLSADLTADDVARIVGRGGGLTPFGDDVLCGWLALHRGAGVPTLEVDAAVRAHLGATTLLSATLLDCALHGEVIPEFAAYVGALGTPAEDAAAAALAAVGHTSGAGMLYGARLALTRIDHLKGAA